MEELDFYVSACAVFEVYIPFSNIVLQVWPRMCKFSLLTPFSQVPSVA